MTYEYKEFKQFQSEKIEDEEKHWYALRIPRYVDNWKKPNEIISLSTDRIAFIQVGIWIKMTNKEDKNKTDNIYYPIGKGFEADTCPVKGIWKMMITNLAKVPPFTDDGSYRLELFDSTKKSKNYYSKVFSGRSQCYQKFHELYKKSTLSFGDIELVFGKKV